MDPERVAKRLSDFSVRAFAPLPQISEWPDALDPNEWHMSPELVSLYGTPAFDALDEAGQKRLAFHELVNFFSLNIHGERFLLGGLSEQIYGPAHRPAYSYIHHFIDEENKHLNYFGTFCTRYARIYPDRKLALPREYDPGERELLFFTKVLVFEEIVDTYNVHIADDARIAPLVRQMNEMHHLDEVRHLAFGQLAIVDLWERFSKKWSTATRARVSEYVSHYIGATFREYYNPQAYGDAGLSDAYDLVDVAKESTRELRRRITRKVVDFLLETGIVEDEPSL